jgi:hypothetical protein
METTMKAYIALLILVAALGGCVVVPVGYDGAHGDYYGERAHDRRDNGYSYERQDRHPGNGNYGGGRYYDGHDH